MSISDLTPFEIYALHWDERGEAMTASFEGPFQAEPDHDWIKFHLRFPAVADVRVRGWNHQTPIKIEQTRTGDRVSVMLTGEGTDVRFTSEPPVEAGRRTYRSAPI
jgi:hypothetical protein